MFWLLPLMECIDGFVHYIVFWGGFGLTYRVFYGQTYRVLFATIFQKWGSDLQIYICQDFFKMGVIFYLIGVILTELFFIHFFMADGLTESYLAGFFKNGWLTYKVIFVGIFWKWESYLQSFFFLADGQIYCAQFSKMGVIMHS